MIQHFLDYMAIEKKYSPKTVQAYGDDLRDFCSFLGWESTDYNPAEVSESDIQAWLVSQMDDQHNKPRSVRRRLSALRSFYKFLLRTGIVQKDVTRMIQSPKIDKPLPVFFKPAEMEQATLMDEHADDFESIRNGLIIQMLYQTGMRQAEMLNLQDTDIRLDAAEIRIFGKRRKERIVPIGENLMAAIRNYYEVREQLGASDGTVFVQQNKKNGIVPLSKTTLYNIVRARMGEVSTLKKHSPHVLRHTFATTMLDNGADIRTIQQLLGHASLAATQVYTHTTFEQIMKTYNAAHPRGKGKL